MISLVLSQIKCKFLYLNLHPGQALGDPHIKTGDGLDYTMNGLGEFILLKVTFL